ncbi:LOW QUALITY PROTEIN: putative transposase, partial [Streptomyces himastatinicus ATCC 53653]
MAAGHSIDPARWQEAFDGLMSRIAGRFARVEPRRRVRRLVLGLLSDLPRKNCWTIAEWAGERTPDGMQHLLGRAKWDADQVRDDLRDHVVEHLHDDQAVLVVDETGDVKKGTGTVGVQRQYTGTAGRIENAQVAVYLVYAGRRGHGAVDRELYVPRSWTADPDRCRDAGLGQDTAFATKPELATRMITRFLDAGHHISWVAGDEVYGGNPKLRAALEKRGTGYVLAVACSAEVWEVPRGRPGQEAPEAGLAEAVRRSGSQGAPLLRLGRHRPGRPRPRQPPAADPPQPHHRRTRLLPLLRTPARAPDHPGAGRWIKVASGRDVPVRQGPGRTGRAPGPPLCVLVPRGHPGHARPCFPRCRPRRRVCPPPRTRHPHTAHLQRNPAPVHHSRYPPRPRHGPPARLVPLATPPPDPFPGQPLPATSHSTM